jgi:hypothetical protein
MKVAARGADDAVESRKGASMDGTAETKKTLGDQALWGRVGYAGEAFAPAEGTYAGVSATGLNYTHIADSGRHPMPGTRGAALANLMPLVLGAMWEAAFALEAGPLSTWSN